MKHYYYQNPDSPEQIKQRLLEVVHKYYGDKIEPGFLEYISDTKNLKINMEILETARVKVDVRIVNYYKIEHKFYEVVGYELKEKWGGTLSLDEKIKNHTKTYFKNNDKEHEGLWKSVGRMEIDDTSKYGEEKLGVYAGFTPHTVLPKDVRATLELEQTYEPESRALAKGYWTGSEHAKVVSSGIEKVEVKNIYEDSAEIYVYPNYDITVDFGGKTYNIPYGMHGERLEKDSYGRKEANFTAPTSNDYKTKKIAQINRTFKLSLTAVVASIITFLISASMMIRVILESQNRVITDRVEGGVLSGIGLGGIYSLIMAICAIKRAIDLKHDARQMKRAVENDNQPCGYLKVSGYVIAVIINIATILLSLIMF